MANEEIKQETPVLPKIKVSRAENDSAIIHIDVDGENFPIMFEDIAPYWQTGSKSLINNIGAFVQGRLVLCWCCSQNGAQGVIFIWDSKSKKIIHVSEGSYTRKVIVWGALVFSLRELPKDDINDLVLCVSQGPCMNADNKKMVQMIPLNIKIFDKKFNIENYKLAVKDNTIIAGFRNEIRQIKANIKKPDAPTQTENDTPKMPS